MTEKQCPRCGGSVDDEAKRLCASCEVAVRDLTRLFYSYFGTDDEDEEGES